MPRRALVLSVLLSAATAHAQDEAAQPPSADAAPAVTEPVFGVDTPLYDPSGRAMEPFHEALRRAAAGEDQARILVYGASHVAADLYTNVLRERLQERFGNAGHGFIMPALPWRHYRHSGGITVEASRRWTVHRVDASTREVGFLGHAGIAMDSDSSADWGRVDTGPQTADRFELYYWEQPGGGSFDVLVDGRRVQRIATGAEHAGPGYAEVRADNARHVLEIRPRGDGPVRIFGASVERTVPGVIVDTIGINGARAISHLYWDEGLHTHYLRRRAPSLVVLAYGTNESGDDDSPVDRYEGTLRSVVARVRGTVPGASCLLVGPSDWPLRAEDGTLVPRPRTAELVAVQQRVARDFGCAFFDLVAFGGGPLHMVQWASAEPPFAQDDLVHYTVRGYLRLGEVLHTSLLAGFEAPAR
jgi:hypothetical protein